MQLQTTHPPVQPKHEEIVTLKLWEIYLMYHPADLYRILTENSIDKGPLYDQIGAGRVVFRFSTDEWESHIKHLLYRYRIPVIIQSNPLSAVKVKGRAPVLR